MSKNKIEFSVVIPMFNKQNEIARAVNSVLHQTIPNFEIIVVNDGSTDRSVEIVRQFCDSRIRLINQSNQGVSVARNRGIREAVAPIVAFLDADDEWAPDFLETIKHLATAYPSCSVFATRYYFGQTDGKRFPCRINGLPAAFREGIIEDYFYLASTSDPPLHASSIAVMKWAIQEIHGFPEGVAVGEDLHTWMRLALRFKIAYSMKIGAVFWQNWNSKDHNRVPATPDRLGEEIARSLSEYHSNANRSLKKYASHWHTMRASIFLQNGMNSSVREEVGLAIRYSGRSSKLISFYLLSFLHPKITQVLMKKILILKNYFHLLA